MTDLLKNQLDNLKQRFDDLSDTVDTQVNKRLGFLDNKYISPFIAIILIVYANMAAPKLPENVVTLFDSTWFKILFLSLIAYNAKNDPAVSLIAAVVILVGLNTLDKYDVSKEVKDLIGMGDDEQVSEPEPISDPIDDGLSGAADENGESYAPVEGMRNVRKSVPKKTEYVGYDDSDTSSYQTV